MCLAPQDMLRTFKTWPRLKALCVKVESPGETTQIDGEEQGGSVQNTEVTRGPRMPRQASGRGEVCMCDAK